MVHTYATGGVTGTTNSDNAAWDVNVTPTDKSATYLGDAVGMSLHKEVDVDNEITSIDSGRFDADVTLTATFGEAPMLRGTIDNFRGNAVDPEWTVKLNEALVTDGGVAEDVGVTVASGDNGVWSAASYGEADARPTLASTAASLPTSRTGMLPARTPPRSSSNRNGIQNPVSSKGRPFVPPFFFPTVWRWTSRNAQKVLGRFWVGSP